MYFPTSAARQLSSVPALPLPSELVLAIAPSPRKTLFVAVTGTGLSLWRVRVRTAAYALGPFRDRTSNAICRGFVNIALCGDSAPLAHGNVGAGTRGEFTPAVVPGRDANRCPGACSHLDSTGSVLTSADIQTTLSYLVLLSIDYNAEELPYQSPPLAPNAARHFLPGAGEALPFQSLSLRLDGVIRIEGILLKCVSSPP